MSPSKITGRGNSNPACDSQYEIKCSMREAAEADFNGRTTTASGISSRNQLRKRHAPSNPVAPVNNKQPMNHPDLSVTTAPARGPVRGPQTFVLRVATIDGGEWATQAFSVPNRFFGKLHYNGESRQLKRAIRNDLKEAKVMAMQSPCRVAVTTDRVSSDYASSDGRENCRDRPDWMSCELVRIASARRLLNASAFRRRRSLMQSVPSRTSRQPYVFVFRRRFRPFPPASAASTEWASWGAFGATLCARPWGAGGSNSRSRRVA